MMKTPIALACVIALVPTARADHPSRLEARDAAGVWTGVVSGTFMGQPYGAVTTVTIAEDGLSSDVRSDSTLGSTLSHCDVASFSSDGEGVAHCVFTTGPATGAPYDVHYVLTDGKRRLPLWVARPGLFASGDFTRP